MGESTTRLLARPERLAEVDRLGLLGPDVESRMQRLCRLAARLAGARFAQVSVLTDRQIAVGAVGVSPGARVTGLDNSACVFVAASGATLVARRAAEDGRLAVLPAVRSGAVTRYAGVPLISGAGEVAGVLCVYDDQDLDWPDDLATVLDDLAGAAVTELEYAARARLRPPVPPAGPRPAPGPGRPDRSPAAGEPGEPGEPGEATDVPDAFRDAGALLRDYLAVDWEHTPLGPPSRWPASLRTALSVCLTNPLPCAISWGGELTLLYNQHVAPLIGDKHPAALGAPYASAMWELWDVAGAGLADVVATGRGAAAQDVLFPVALDGEIRERWWSYGR